MVRFPPQTKTKKSFSSPTSFSRLQWVWHLAMQKPLCIIQKFGPTQMSKRDTSICCYETEQGTERPDFFLGILHTHMLHRGAHDAGLLNSCTILAGFRVNGADLVWIHAVMIPQKSAPVFRCTVWRYRHLCPHQSVSSNLQCITQECTKAFTASDILRTSGCTFNWLLYYCVSINCQVKILAC